MSTIDRKGGHGQLGSVLNVKFLKIIILRGCGKVLFELTDCPWTILLLWVIFYY